MAEEKLKHTFLPLSFFPLPPDSSDESAHRTSFLLFLESNKTTKLIILKTFDAGR